MNITIIIPTQNEQKFIGKILTLIEKRAEKNVHEIIIVDKNSTDNTLDIARAYTTKIIKLSSKNINLAKQLNIAAEKAKGDILYFLHADTIPPVYFDKLVVDAIKVGYKSGSFNIKFDSNHLIFKLSFLLKYLKDQRYGDQSFFIKKRIVYRNRGL